MMRGRRLSQLVAGVLLALIIVVASAVLWPRIARLQTATSAAGRAVLVVVYALFVLSAVLPVAMIRRSLVWRPALASTTAIAFACAVVLSFNEGGGSDGLFVLALGVAALIATAAAGGAVAFLLLALHRSRSA